MRQNPRLQQKISMQEKRFRWEEEFQNTWDGHQAQEETAKLRVSRRTRNARRGIVRKLLLVLDMSASIEERDMLPSRKHHLREGVISFFRSFSESNPLSTMGVSVATNGQAHLAASVVADEEIINAIFDDASGSGKFSLSASLECALAFFAQTAALKEIVFVVSSLSFFGSSPYKYITDLAKKGVRMHAVHLSAEMSILQRITSQTGGACGVVNMPEDLCTLLDLISIPPPYSGTSRLSMLRVGFPRAVQEHSICACHLEVTESGYVCPFCTTKVCSVPRACPICEGMLTSSVYLLKPLHWVDSAPEESKQNILERKKEDAHVPEKCKSCSASFAPSNASAPSPCICSGCGTLLCADCARFMRSMLNFCIFCNARSRKVLDLIE